MKIDQVDFYPEGYNCVMTVRQARGIYVHTESSPNPHSLKFIVNIRLLPEGVSFNFPTASSAVDAPLARELFTYAFVVHVFYADNFITITKKEGVAWSEVQDTISIHIKNFIMSGQAIICDSAWARKQGGEGNDLVSVKKIKSILDKHIRPAVQRDGGDIVFYSYVNGVLKVCLQGACKGCPGSTATLKVGVENIFKEMMPNEVTTVEALD